MAEHPVALTLGLLNQRYDMHIQACDQRLSDVETWNHQLSRLTDLLITVNAARKDGAKKVSLSSDEHRALLDEVREIAPNLLPNGVYEWKGDEIDLLTQGIASKSREIGNLVNPTMMLLNQDIQDMDRFIEISQKILSNDKEGTSRILSNMIVR